MCWYESGSSSMTCYMFLQSMRLQKIAVPKMRSNQENLSVVESVGIASCTRRGQNEVCPFSLSTLHLRANPLFSGSIRSSVTFAQVAQRIALYSRISSQNVHHNIINPRAGMCRYYRENAGIFRGEEMPLAFRTASLILRLSPSLHLLHPHIQ